MAVIRTERLFVARIPFTGLGLSRPKDWSEHPEQYATNVYQPPVGYRAILRTFTAVLSAVPPGTHNPAVWLTLFPLSTGAYDIHWYWFYELTGMTTWTVRLADTWNAMVVIHGGEWLGVTVAGGSGYDVQVHGSGHFLPEQPAE